MALKGAIWDLYNLLTAPQTVSNRYAQVAQAQSCANHMQHIQRLSHATWYEGTAQLLSVTVEIAFILALFYWLKPLTDEGGGGNQHLF